MISVLCTVFVRVVGNEPHREPQSPSIARSTFDDMLECIRRGESWQDAMDQGEGPGGGERTNDHGRRS